MMAKPDFSDYIDVAERIRDFRAAHPEGTLQSEIIASPIDGFICVKGYAYRTPDDPRPGIGLAWENVPGKTPFTKDSELMNAETSAWGRAIIAVGASDAKRVSSREEIQNRQPAPRPSPESDKDRLTNRAKATAMEAAGGDTDLAKSIFQWATADKEITPDTIEDIEAAIKESAKP